MLVGKGFLSCLKPQFNIRGKNIVEQHFRPAKFRLQRIFRSDDGKLER